MRSGQTTSLFASVIEKDDVRDDLGGIVDDGGSRGAMAGVGMNVSFYLIGYLAGRIEATLN